MQTHRTPRPPATPERALRDAFCRVASGVALSTDAPCRDPMLAALGRAADCLTNAVAEMQRGDLARVDYLVRMAEEHVDAALQSLIDARKGGSRA